MPLKSDPYRSTPGRALHDPVSSSATSLPRSPFWEELRSLPRRTTREHERSSNRSKFKRSRKMHAAASFRYRSLVERVDFFERRWSGSPTPTQESLLSLLRACCPSSLWSRFTRRTPNAKHSHNQIRGRCPRPRWDGTGLRDWCTSRCDAERSHDDDLGRQDAHTEHPGGQSTRALSPYASPASPGGSPRASRGSAPASSPGASSRKRCPKVETRRRTRRSDLRGDAACDAASRSVRYATSA